MGKNKILPVQLVAVLCASTSSVGIANCASVSTCSLARRSGVAGAGGPLGRVDGIPARFRRTAIQAISSGEADPVRRLGQLKRQRVVTVGLLAILAGWPEVDQAAMLFAFINNQRLGGGLAREVQQGRCCAR